ncbi:MAG: CoA transferase subunit A [Rhodospirillaceae bacterium]|jgi:glutaconate CoA-transferase subunit A|nr:CoA transferase subunit A [Rhodospirillaceae bacterium]MBT7484956.1 CoA transferase subunit A [Rhodospirillales bacterium]MBT4702804.1 CoA transferase subunit A [Rhodospirillaceae bacterium]MBT5036837.1 CoA transferase subunit A [Rhodospirillaceae bacterium]MBT6218416.1 CoA transferase subunit A [Rhodospirillaceae bacterium]
MDKSKSLSQAVSENISNGDTVFVGGFGHCVPFALGHEILRQQLTDLTICRSGADILFDQMIAGGAVRKIIFGYFGNPGIGLSHAFRRAVKDGTLEYEDWTNFAMMLRLHAAQLGVPFLPSRILQLGDMARLGELSGTSIQVETMECPYTGDHLACIPALAPDVAVVHAPQADTAGNIQFHGVDGDTVMGALASKRIVVTVERFVDADEIARMPERTRLPAHRVNAVALVPWGAHPSYVDGDYGRDDEHFRMYDTISRDADTLMDYLKTWVYDCPDREAYLRCIGEDLRSELKARVRERMDT